MIQNFKDRRVTVMGLGRFGGGVGVIRWLVERGARVTLTDQAPADKLADSLREIADLRVTQRLGRHDERDFRDTDLVVVNPAVPPRSPFLQVARDTAVPITTEINLFVERCAARCVGVTGTVGKSTVTAMIGHVLAAVAGTADLRRVWVGGNIGRSLLHVLPEIDAADVVVLELSSFQLERTPIIRWSPHVAVLTNILPNHLDWHGDFASYQAAKLNIARFQVPARDTFVVQDLPALCAALPARLGAVCRYALEGDVPVTRRDDALIRWDDLRLAVPGRHNRENAAAALAVAATFGLDPAAARAALTTFAALPHRLQFVGEQDGVKYYDDSKSTTPEAALTALAALDEPLLVILGGYDKGSDLRPLAAQVARRARFAACIGTTGPGLVEAIRAANGAAELCPDLATAVQACCRRARAGDAVLLSPACASWDQFVDYRERGAAFTRLVRGVTEPVA